MKPYIKSNYPRRENDNYPTIDKRCIYGLLEHISIDKSSDYIVDPCSFEGSAIVDTLRELGYIALAIPDAFMEFNRCQWIITNPPYDRKVVDNIIEKQLQRMFNKQVENIAILLRSEFDYAKSRQEIFSLPNYYGQIKLLFRPWWSEERKAQPIHNYCWHIWTNTELLSRPIVLYSKGEK